jgi:hypothetical protein
MLDDGVSDGQLWRYGALIGRGFASREHSKQHRKTDWVFH